jgi:hypothetical protein
LKVQAPCQKQEGDDSNELILVMNLKAKGTTQLKTIPKDIFPIFGLGPETTFCSATVFSL